MSWGGAVLDDQSRDDQHDEGLEPGELWGRATAELRLKLADGHFSAWFEKAQPVAFTGNRFVLSLPHKFAKDWIEGHYRDALDEALSGAAGRPIEAVLTARPEPTPEPEDPAATLVAAAAPPLSFLRDEAPQFHPKYTFDSFVIGSSNRFAHAAALAVAEAPAQAYNPLFIYGGAGLGKTHLLQAIGHYVQDCHPTKVIRYVSTEQFMNDFILSLQRRTIPHFHRRFRMADLLLIDDIQFLEGKERTQEEFFHTFNALHPKSQIVITSDRPPKKIPTLEDRLSTRFEWGLITDIQPPDLETRMAILQGKAEAERLSIPSDVLNFIASRIQTNIRALEGALIRVAAYASLNRTPASLELAHTVLQSLLPDSREGRVTADLVMSVAASYYDVGRDEIASSSRSRSLVNARQMAMYLCRELTDMSLPKIGERFGGRDHTTVLHATKKIRNQMQTDENCYEQVSELTARIRQQAARG